VGILPGGTLRTTTHEHMIARPYEDDDEKK
jgi:hypothetical protein